MSFEEFNAGPLAQPIRHWEIPEGEYGQSIPNREFDHILTLGVQTCKAITLHTPDARFGLLAHLDGTTRSDEVLSNMLHSYPYPVSETDVSILQATTSEYTRLWPDIESIAGFFMRHNPRSLRLDYNRGHGPIRGVALNLQTGTVHSTGHRDPLLAKSVAYHRLGIPLSQSMSKKVSSKLSH